MVTKSNRGFIGILSLLIAIALIALFFFRSSGDQKSDEATGVSNEETQSPVDLGLDAIEKAKDTKAMLEARDKDLGESIR